LKEKRNIFITGSHRSGTEWVGRMIATDPSVDFIQEPFNINHEIGVCNAFFNYWFTYVCDKNEHDYYQSVKDTFEFRYHLLDQIKSVKGYRPIIRAILSCGVFFRNRISNLRPLIKDPLALFSADWISSRFNTKTIIVIRHPAAFVGSIKARNWSHPFSHFLKQPLLMKDHLYPFEREIRKFAEKERNIVDSAALLWKIIHFMILKYKKVHPEWKYIRNEDISRDPNGNFKELFEWLNLKFTKEISKTVQSHSRAKNHSPIVKSYNLVDIERDSIANMNLWKKLLTKDEIKRVKDQVYDVSREFYSEEEW